MNPFAGHKYMNLETFRKNGAGVRTPVWFAEKDGVLYVYTLSHSGKIKRNRNNPRVRIVPSDMRGRPLAEWMDGEARLIPAEEAQAANRLLNKKYLVKRLFDWTSKLRRAQRAYFAVKVK
jgi:PPOX class probable F420-dependent enzyme